MSTDPSSLPAPRQYPVRAYNQRMARRMVRRAHIDGESGVAVAFAFNNLFTTVVLGTILDIVQFVPIVGAYADLAISLLSFYFHRIVLVTDRGVYVFRDWPFHFPGRRLLTTSRQPGVVRLGAPSLTSSAFMRFIRRGQLTFEDGTVVYHSFIWIRRARYIAQEANLPPGT